MIKSHWIILKRQAIRANFKQKLLIDMSMVLLAPGASNLSKDFLKLFTYVTAN
jgi:hypothetical protein